MADSFFKKENRKKKIVKKKLKSQKREDRKANNNKGKGLESMIVYVDENGHLTNTPPAFMKTNAETASTDAASPKIQKPEADQA
ncbi:MULTISPECIES: hypothetical protein [unclassified Flavobacterium]|uniref:hypothetical protein n=1 Tax=unclassified Flavobacterium TaxID=196869 RepID=UPI0036188021